MKKTLFIALLLAFSASVIAQGVKTETDSKKSSCSPAACGPEDTKKGEAIAITELRNDLVALITDLGDVATKLNIKISSMETEVLQGNTDDESLLLIGKNFLKIRKEVELKIPSIKLGDPLTLEFDEANKAKYLAGVQNQIKRVREQLRVTN